MKQLLYITGGTVLLSILFMGGCRMLSKQIFNHQDCKRFNIDNIELRTGIDIPAIENAIFECAPGTKDAEFTLKINPEDLEHYLSQNKFKWVNSTFINSNEDIIPSGLQL
ncbi:MAG: hypothetical protein ACJAV5_000123 [Vicingaceae bacterium]|jgi:hypothetical protein